MKRIVQRTTQDGGSITQIITVYDGGLEPGEVQESANTFAAILERGRRQRRWIAGIGAALLAIEAVILL